MCISRYKSSLDHRLVLKYFFKFLSDLKIFMEADIIAFLESRHLFIMQRLMHSARKSPNSMLSANKVCTERVYSCGKDRFCTHFERVRLFATFPQCLPFLNMPSKTF